VPREVEALAGRDSGQGAAVVDGEELHALSSTVGVGCRPQRLAAGCWVSLVGPRHLASRVATVAGGLAYRPG
jgi:hypothetical protein